MDGNIKTTEHLDEPWQDPWPPEALESVVQCPICGQVKRNILHAGLIDNSFRVAAGEWTLWKCAQCGSAYLDPRPAPEATHLAYKSYYTHQMISDKVNYRTLSPFRKLRRFFANSYSNWRYSTHEMPSSVCAALVVLAAPPLKKIIDRGYRDLPKLPAGGGTLLDVGCGNGSFLRLARTCGWNVVGLDPDAKAGANAAKDDLTVFEGDTAYYSGKSDLFDVITLSHVIEHVHDPVKVLKTCYTLLKAGGQLWLETPNIESYGHARFQKNWRGLETPRHLVLFNRSSLNQAIISAGFTISNYRGTPCPGMFKASLAMERGLSPYQAMEFPMGLLFPAIKLWCAELLVPSRREYLTVVAHKK